MDAENAVALVVALLLVAYLVVALVKAEDL